MTQQQIQDTFYTYNNIQQDNKTKLSPSAFPTSISNPGKWYKQQISKTDVFNGNKSTIIGTLVHAYAHILVHNSVNPDEQITEPDIIQAETDYLDAQLSNNTISLVELNEIVAILPHFKTLTHRYVTATINDISHAEFPIQALFNANQNYLLAGTVDAILSDGTLIDYKTSTRKPSKISTYHLVQTLIYAYIINRYLASAGSVPPQINTINIVHFIVSPKTFNAQRVVFESKVTDAKLDWIEKHIQLLITRIELVKKDPQLEELLFPDNILDNFVESTPLDDQEPVSDELNQI